MATGSGNSLSFAMNTCLLATEAPPIAEVQGWISDRSPDVRSSVIDLLQAMPGYPPDAGLTQHIAEQARRADTAAYTPIAGNTGLREALADDVSDAYGASLKPDEVCITAGCNQAFYLAAIALAGAGDGFILPAPYYFNHKMTLDMLGITAQILPTCEKEAFVPDPHAAAALIHARTRALVLVTPNNPTGACYPPEVLIRFLELAQRHRIALILDETYRDFSACGAGRPHALFQYPDWQANLVHLYSFSKAFSLAGYRVGAMIAAPPFLAQALKIMDCLAICAPHIGQLAAEYGLRHLRGWRREKRGLAENRATAFRAALEASAHPWSIASSGAYFAYVRHPFENRPAMEVARLLAEQGHLLTLPGSAFGPGQEQFLRVAFSTLDAGEMPEIARRLRGCVIS